MSMARQSPKPQVGLRQQHWTASCVASTIVAIVATTGHQGMPNGAAESPSGVCVPVDLPCRSLWQVIAWSLI